MLIDVVPITPEVIPGEISPFTPFARDQKIKAFTSYPHVTAWLNVISLHSVLMFRAVLYYSYYPVLWS